MTTFNADIALEPPRTPRFGGLIARKATFTVPTGFLQASDDIRFLNVPRGAQLVDMLVTKDATGTATLNIGDAGDADRYFAAVAAGATFARAALATGLNFQFTADTPLTGAFLVANPTAGAVITLRCSYLLTP